ncbi:MAG: TIGR03668 family PPOX class F420-dependent oxidoreductase [Terriglobia bacterium]
MASREGHPLKVARHGSRKVRLRTDQKAFRFRLAKARIAHMATIGAGGFPHIVPVCFVYDGSAFYTPLDLKPKRVPPQNLARVRNIMRDSRVSLIVDEYIENWKALWYILVRGNAFLLQEGRERADALRQLREKYPQYAACHLLPKGATLIRIAPTSFIAWGRPGP